MFNYRKYIIKLSKHKLNYKIDKKLYLHMFNKDQNYTS